MQQQQQQQQQHRTDYNATVPVTHSDENADAVELSALEVRAGSQGGVDAAAACR
jgi:hypothetical protein